MNLYERVLKIIFATIRKRMEDTLCLDWDPKFLLSVSKFLFDQGYDGTHFIVAEKVFNHVIKEVKPPFNMRTEDLGRKLDKESLLQRKPIYDRDTEGKLVHKVGWLINTKLLKRRVSKFEKLLPTIEEFQEEEKERMLNDLEKNSSVGKIVRPKNGEE